MFALKCLLIVTLWCVASAQQYQTTTPVPILKQVNKQNDDGSYSFGYEAADGSFKIETKYPNGDVAGKYGYVDVDGKLREISYGAGSKRGFEPQGTGIMVPPPTIHEQPSNALTDGQEDDGQYREDPSVYEDPKYNSRSQKSRPAPIQTFRQYHQPAQPQYQQQTQPQYQQQSQTQPQYQQQTQTQPQYHQQTQYQPQTQYQQQSQYQPQTQYQPQPQQPFHSGPLYSQSTSLSNQFPQQDYNRPQSQIYHQQPQFSYQAYTPQPYNSQGFPQNYNPFLGHPAQNIDPNTGSYTINFTG